MKVNLGGAPTRNNSGLSLKNYFKDANGKKIIALDGGGFPKKITVDFLVKTVRFSFFP